VMTDDEVQVAALTDSDAQPLTDADFARMTRVPRVKTLRRALHLSQEEFYGYLGSKFDTDTFMAEVR